MVLSSSSASPASAGQTGLGKPEAPDGQDTVEEWIRYTRLENLPILARRQLPHPAQQVLLARLAGCSIQHAAAAHQRMAAAVGRAADQLLAEPETRAATQSLPLHAADRIVAVGDSLTADRLGWADILAAALRRTPPYTSTEVVNAGLAGTTTTDTVERFDLIAAHKPTQLLLMIGTNDARSSGPDGQPLLSPEETRRNVAILENLAGRIHARLLWLLPPPIAATRTTRRDGDHWREPAVTATRSALRSCTSAHLDLAQPPAIDPTDHHQMHPDGVHPTPNGQVRLARAIIRRAARRIEDDADP